MSYPSIQGYMLLKNHEQLLGRSWFVNDFMEENDVLKPLQISSLILILKHLVMHYGIHDLM